MTAKRTTKKDDGSAERFQANLAEITAPERDDEYERFVDLTRKLVQAPEPPRRNDGSVTR